MRNRGRKLPGCFDRRRSRKATAGASCLTFFIFHFSFFIQAHAQLSFPLQGYYRPGKYMPVRIAASELAQRGQFIIEAPGALPTEITISSQSDLIVPWLAISDSLG